MDILRVQEIAKDEGFDSAEFYADFPAGRQLCRWLDAYFGLFTIPAIGEGFMQVKQMDAMFPGLNCEPVRPGEQPKVLEPELVK